MSDLALFFASRRADLENVPASATAILTGEANGTIVGELTVANTDTSTARDITVEVYDGTNSTAIFSAYSIAANDTLIKKWPAGLALEKDDELRLTASQANTLDAVVSYVTVPSSEI